MRATFFSLLISAALGAVSSPPNVIVIFADDLGYGDLSCYGGAKDYPTPHIDQLAAEGLLLEDFSVASPVCSPSRAALLTGRYPKRIGVQGVFFPDRADGLSPKEITLAELLKANGYHTAAVGKWHLGHKKKFLPINQGFDEYFGIPYSNDMWQDPEYDPSPSCQFNEGKTLQDYRTKLDRRELAKRGLKNLVPLIEGNDVIEWPVDQRTITKRFTQRAQNFINQSKRGPSFCI